MVKFAPINISRSAKLRKKSTLIILLFILLFALWLRIGTLWISHWRGDQNIYLGLAMKLEKYGLDQYNISGIDIGMVSSAQDNSILLLTPVPAKTGTRGEVLDGLLNTGLTYYNMPLFQNAPGFPYALLLSHRIFLGKEMPYAVAFSKDNYKLRGLKLQQIRNTQFFAVIIPLLASIMTIFTIFLLGKYLFSDQIGLYAAFIYSINPVNIMTSQKIWADDMLTFFVILTVLFFLVALRKKIPIMAFFAGLACGIATLTKQTGILLAPALWLFIVLLKRKDFYNIRGIVKAIFNSYFLFFLIGLLISSGFWFYKVYLVYGTPFFWPDIGDAVAKDTTGWFKVVAGRPHPYILFSIGIPFICPLFLLAYFSIKNFILNLKKIILGEEFNYVFIILWLWILIFYITAIGKEHRYMLPIYPPLAILSAYYLSRIKIFIATKSNAFFGEIIIILILLVSAVYTIPLGLNTLMQGTALFLKPF